MTPEDYIQLAEQERARQWNIAKERMKTPSLPNVLSALRAVWNAMPFNTTSATVNPYMLYGDAPIAGGPIKPLSTFEKLSRAAKVANAKSLIVRKANAAKRIAAEKQIGEAGINAPVAAKAIELGYNVVRHPKQTYGFLKDAVIKPIKLYADEAKQFVKDITWQIRPERMEAVNNAFRDSEWSNFLSTRNGDNYYRMVNPKIERYSPKEKYFLSHTTPWEEFSGRGGEFPIGTTRLYEFPTSTFGRLRSTTSKGVPTEYDVTKLGRQHLLYGNTASGVRGPVRLMSDANAKFLGEPAFGIRPVERPLTKNGLFDANPDFENIHIGNQTTLKGRTIERALNESTYNIFENSPFGIIKTIHVPIRK